MEEGKEKTLRPFRVLTNFHFSLVWAWKFDDDIQEENPNAFKFLQMARAWKMGSAAKGGAGQMDLDKDDSDEESDSDEDGEGEKEAEEKPAENGNGSRKSSGTESDED